MSKNLPGILIFGLCLSLSSVLIAQNDPKFLVITKVHFNPKSESSPDQCKAMEKEYFDKVTMKNDFIVGANCLLHFYTKDNSEINFTSSYRSWEDIQKAEEKSNELARAAWPDSVKRNAFFIKRNSCYTSLHSDEIRSILPNTKVLTATTPQVYWVRTSHLAFPADAKPGELRELQAEYVQHVINKNTLLKGYYPSRHLWGADGREYVEAFVFATLADMEKAADENEKLIKAHWPDEAKRKEFFAKLDRYFEPYHGDEIYRHVPELRKFPAPASAPAATK